MFGRAELRRRYPGISARYAGAAFEFEALISTPERVVIELLEDAVNDGSGSVALNYVRLNVERDRLTFVDQTAGAAFEIRARVVINAAGANVDKVARQFGVEAHMVDGVAGTHLIMHAPGIAEALGEDLLFFEDTSADLAKRRLCCVYALGRKVLLGATETPIADADKSRPLPAEHAYLLAALRGLFPDAKVSEADIVERLHGVRPLAAVDADDVTGRSRDHVIHTHPGSEGQPPLVSIAGGKWTTFRAIAEDAANAALAALDLPRASSTDRRPIGGGQDWPVSPEALAKRPGLGVALAERLIAAYGSRAARVAAYLDDDRGRQSIAGGGLTVGEVIFLVREEMATSAEDIARRRCRLFVEGLATPETLSEIDRALALFTANAAQEVLQHAPV